MSRAGGVAAEAPPEDDAPTSPGAAGGSVGRGRRLAARLGPDGVRWLAGAVASVAVAIGLFSRFSIDILLNRDEAIYTYSGQQLSRGVPPYASIFDPKTPLESMIAGVAAAFAHAIGRNDVYMIRAAFFVCSCLTVLAVYVLAARLWRSVLGGLVAAVVFASFQAFAHDALAGPDAKTPGVLLVVLSMWLLVRRNWFWGALTASFGFLVWQPFVFYGLVAVLVAFTCAESGERRSAGARAVAGVTIPLVASIVYFAAVGALGKFLESTVAYPATGVSRSDESVFTRWHRILTVVHYYYKFSGVLFGLGFIAIVVLAAARWLRDRQHTRAVLRDPLICVVGLTMVAELGYASYDFQSYPDVFPLLVYPALGLGGVAAVVGRLGNVLARRAVTAAALVAITVLTAFSWTWFSDSPENNHDFLLQRTQACAIDRVLVPGTPLYALGDPAPLVVTHRRNPDRYIYLTAGVDKWKIHHLKGGFAAWVAQILASRTSVIVVGGWNTPIRHEMGTALRENGFTSGWIGGWYTFLTPAARAHAKSAGVQVTPAWTETPLTLAGAKFSCSNREDS